MTLLTPPHFVQPLPFNANNIQLPEKFTYPFCYQPDPLTTLAVKLLQDRLLAHNKDPLHLEGKMYGVLVVKDENKNIGYLSAVSGDQETPHDIEDYLALVPKIFTGFKNGSDYNKNQIKVNEITKHIDALESAPKLAQLQQVLTKAQAQSSQEISQFQQSMVERRKTRKQQRLTIEHELTDTVKATTPDIYQQAKHLSIELSRQSVQDKKQLTELKNRWKEEASQLEGKLTELLKQIDQLKKDRRKLSHKCQKLLFKQYQLLNINGESKPLIDIFQEADNIKPPAGSGDCAAPKLLQFAFQHQLTPICMAEFWWGQPPRSAVREHKQFYPSCQGKCQPILTHMLNGMEVDANPLLVNPAENTPLDIVFADEHIVVVNKPAGLLSVPGKNIEDSVFTRVKQLYPDASGSLIVHRLDMATSGLLVLALTPRAHKQMQKQFIEKTVSKRYLAIVEGVVEQPTGKIELPLTLDINDRPRQIVCSEQGKRAETHWEVISTSNNLSRLYLYPITGRTHQLRVHCAHSLGLKMPIVGDGLYGTYAKRLCLHAQRLAFTHPVLKQPLVFEQDPEF